MSAPVIAPTDVVVTTPAEPVIDISGITVQLTTLAQEALSDPTKISALTVIHLATQMTATVKTVKGMNSEEKQQLLLTVIKDTLGLQKIKDAIPENDYTVLMSFVADVLPGTLDVIVDAANGKYDLAEEVEAVKSCCVWGLSLFSLFAKKQ